MDIDNEELCRFLVNAKIHTYAGSRKATILKDGSKELMFNEGDFSYRDRYFGENPFIGEEIVCHEGKCLWGMNYYGYAVLSGNFSLEDLYAFLREALKRVMKRCRSEVLKNMRNERSSMSTMWKVVFGGLAEQRRYSAGEGKFIDSYIMADSLMLKAKLY